MVYTKTRNNWLFVAVYNAKYNNDGHTGDRKNGDGQPAIFVSSGDDVAEKNGSRVIGVWGWTASALRRNDR